MKVLFTALGLTIICIFLVGCFSMTTASSETLGKCRVIGAYGRPREHVVVSNYGWYLFNTIPLVCGNASKDAWLPWVFLRDDVTADIVHDHLTSYAAEQHADVAEMNCFFNENMLFEIPGTSIPIPMPYILCYRERLVSGLLMAPPEPIPAPKTIRKVPPASPSTVPAMNDTPKNACTPADEESRKRELNRLLENIPDGGVK